MDLATEPIKFATAILGLLSALPALLAKARGDARKRRKKGHR